MEDPSAEQALRTELLRKSGLAVLDTNYSAGGSRPSDVWRLAASGSTVPAATVEVLPDFGYLEEVDRQWQFLAEERGLFGEDGEFLISVAGERVGRLPWARVRRLGRMALAHHLVAYPGEPEFVAMSRDARVMCGVTTEEYDIWIVAGDLPDRASRSTARDQVADISAAGPCPGRCRA
ncbi:hypothetical protein AB0K15_36920 [Amycolatopsis sp. NPDC049253]|uniref:hypothetical protein n=1 Tax=Amycolatopsis sp. NPDC049253 TaxID=3155274 RepID=UPI003415E1A7